MGQNRSRGKRYSNESKLNYAKIVAVIVALAVLVMFGIAINQLLSYDITKFMAKKEYFAVYEDNKWGVINSLGETVIEPSYAEMIIVPDSTQDIFLCVYEINESEGTYKTKVLNSKNKEIFTDYEQVEALENYDKNQNVWYEENVLKVKNNGKYGLINLKGNSILNCEYDNIYALEGIENSLIIEKNEKIGLVNNKGKVIIDANHQEIKPLGADAIDGYITKDQNGKYGVISINKEEKLEHKYDKIEQVVGNNLYVVTEGQKQKLVNSKGTTILEDGFDQITEILKDSKEVIFVKDNLYGVMNTEGTVTIKNTYESLKELENGLLIAKKDGKCGIIDTNNNVKLYFNYNSIDYVKELSIYVAEDTNFQASIIDSGFEVKLIGILSEVNTELKYIKMHINDEYKYYDLTFEETQNTEVLKGNTLFLSKKDGKYGYVNSEGEVVVDYIYNDATEQNEFGYVAVQKNGKWGSLDSKGQVVTKPTYQLDNNIIIDFIGEWHLGEDLNMNYYCKK